MALNDAELRFQASLEDDASPQIDALIKKLQQAGATPAEIKMYLRAQDEATPHLNRVRNMMKEMPKDHTIRVKVAADQARGHLAMIKKEFAEPVEVPLHFIDNLDHVGQKLFTLKSRYAIPMAGMIPGANMLYGVGMGAGILGAAGGASDLLKKSIDVNAELEQQNASLAQAMKDNTAATQEMGRIMGMAANSQFGRGDLTQADIISRQFNLPSFGGESKYMPKGVVPTAQNLAAVGNTSVASAAEAIARATQGYFRTLMPYGISIRQEDFSPGGRFAGKSYEEAISIATKRFEGAAETQSKTFTGMLSRFHNMFEDKILQPLGMFTFDSMRSTLRNIVGGTEAGGFQSRISGIVNTAQQDLAKLWNLVQKGKDYFDTNLKHPLEEIIRNIVEIGTTFAKVFTGTFVTVLKTLAEALMAIARPITSLINSAPGLVQFFGVMKALSLLGFKDISGPLVNPLKDLATLRFGHLIHDISGIGGALAKIGVALVIKGFVDAHTATKAVNDEFPKMKDNFDEINSRITRMSYGLHLSATSMKELVATAAQGLPKQMDPQHKLELAIDVGKAAAQLHNVTGIDRGDAARAIVQQMKASDNYTAGAVRTFAGELAGATAAAKSLGESFSDVQRVMTQYASVANKAGLGGIGGAGPLTALDYGVNHMQMTAHQLQQYGTPSGLLRSMLQSYAQPSVNDLRTLGRQGFADSYDFRHPTRHQFQGFLATEDALAHQAETARRSGFRAQRRAAHMAPDVTIPIAGQPPASDFMGVSPRMLQQMRSDYKTGDSKALGTDIRDSLVKAATAYKDVNDKVQQLQKSTTQLENVTSTYQIAQSQVNLAMQTYEVGLLKRQQQIQNLQLATEKYTFEALHPLEREMTRLNQLMADNQHLMSNAQYEQSKWADGLITGEQAALDQLHALENYNKQLQLLQLIYQQIGADLGTTIYDQGAEVKVAPMSNIGLAMAMEVAQRKQQIAQLKYDLGPGEGHYQAAQLQRSDIQTTEHSLAQILQHVKSTQGVIDRANHQQHDLSNQQYDLGRQMYTVNEKIQNQTDYVQKLQLAYQSLEQSPYMQRLQRENAHLGLSISSLGLEAQTAQQQLSNYQNVVDNLGQGRQNLGKVLTNVLDLEAGGKWDKAHKALESAVRRHEITTSQFTGMNISLVKAQVAARRGTQHFAATANKQDWKSVIAEGFKIGLGLFTGSTERAGTDIWRGAVRHIPGIGPILANHSLTGAAAIAATSYMALSGARGLLRGGSSALMRGGARALDILHLDPHLGRMLGRPGVPLNRGRLAIMTALAEHTHGAFQRFGLRGMDRATSAIATSEMLRRGERGDILRWAQETQHPLHEARGAFRWIHNGREHLGRGLGGAAGALVGGSIFGPFGAILGGMLGGRMGGRWGEEHTIRETAKLGLDKMDDLRKATNKVSAVIEERPLDLETPEKYRERIAIARKGLDAAQLEVKKSEILIENGRNILQKTEQTREIWAKHDVLTEVRGQSLDKQAAVARDQVKAGEKQLEASHESLKTAREAHAHARAEGNAARRAAGHNEITAKRVREAADKIHGASDKMHETVREAGKHEVKMGEHVGRFGHGIEKFAGLFLSGGAVYEAFDHFFGIKGPGTHHTPGAHKPRLRAKAGVAIPMHPEESVGTPEHDTHVARIVGHPVVRRLGGLFAHGQRGFFGVSGAEGVLGGDPVSETFSAAALTEEAISTARQIKAHGGVKTAAARRVLERYGAKYADNPLAKRALVRAGTSIGVDILAGGTPVVGWAYDLYSTNQLLKHTAVGKALSGPGTDYDTRRQALGRLEHTLLPTGIPATTQAEQVFSQQRLKGASYEILDYLKAHHTSEAEMEKIYAKGGQLPKLFEDYFKNQLFLSKDQAQQDLKTLTDHQTTVIDKTTQHFKDRVTAHTTGLNNVNDTENKGFQNIYKTVDTWLSKVSRRVKRTKSDLGLTHGTQNDAADQTGSADPTSTANAVKNAFASGGIVQAASAHLAQYGGRLIKAAEEGPEMVIPLVPHRRERAKQLIGQVSAIHGFANGGFVPAANTNFSVGDEPTIASDLRRLGQKLGIQFIGVSGYRSPQHSLSVGGFADDPHTRGQAADVGAPTREAFGRLVSDAALKAVGLYRPFGGAQEINHVQLLSGGAQGSLASIGRHGGKLPRTPKALLQSGPVGNVLYHWMAALRKGWQRRLGAGASGMLDPSQFHGGGDAQANMRLGQQMAEKMGWTGSNWDALRSLWIGESGWNEKIMNSTSGATGIPQALPGNKMATAGADWRTNPATQIAWGLNYIKQRYRDPSNAYSQWLSRSPHWYHQGSWNVGQDDHPAVLQKGEMVLPKVMAAAVRNAIPQAIGGHTQPISGGSKRVTSTMDDLVEHIKKLEKQLKELNDKTDKADTRKHLSDLNAELRLSKNQLSAKRNAVESSHIAHMLKGDPTDGEGTEALVDHERAIYRRGQKASPLSRRDRALAAHVNSLSKRAHSLLNSAHTGHQRTLARTAVRATRRAQNDVNHVRHLATQIHHQQASNQYIVGAAKRGIDQSLIHSVTGRRLSPAEMRNYKIVEQHLGTAKQQAKSLSDLRKELNKGLGHQEKQLAVARKDAEKHAKQAEVAVRKAADAQRKTTASTADHADKNRRAAEASADKRDRDFQKQALKHLENIAGRDLSVSIHNEAHGATLTTTSTRTRRRKR